MDKNYDYKKHEEELAAFWEAKGYFNGQINPDKKPFSIILPPPNANADLHLGHAMYVYEDVMIRYHKLQGHEVLWLAGADHAGIETQFVYEKHLKKQGKSRFDFDRETLFSDIWEFVMKNRGTMENQLRRLGFALDWSKKQFTMDEGIVKIVHQTFADLHKDGLIYRANRLVNYCTSCGTSFSDLEVVDTDVDGFLYYIQYQLVGEDGAITIATTRPETLFGDVAVMVHPGDKRYASFIGKKVKLPLTSREIPVIADEYVDPKFGTGAVKVTPAHDFNDFEVGKRHHLEEIVVIDFGGKMQGTGIVDGVYFAKARKLVLEKLEEEGLLEETKEHHMVAQACYRCGTVLQPLPKEQWFLNVKPLREQAIKLVNEGKIKIHPTRFKKELIRILENFIDWNVSRQIVWGIRIPAYRCLASRQRDPSVSPQDDKASDWFVSVEKPEKCQICGACKFVQDEDTFDTWFSSGQWPVATLKNLGQEFYDYFYPTTVMETGYDILRAWVSRMIMLGYYATKDVPFEHVFLHGMVRDPKGQKMSKSKGNVINPLDMIEKYGADALRAALIFGTKEGGDVVLSEDKIKAMRNFANKIWNIGRFIQMSNTDSHESHVKDGSFTSVQDDNESQDDMVLGIRDLKKEFASVEKQYHQHFKKFEFAKAFDLSYEFLWHRFADYYIEQLKEPMQHGTIEARQEMELVYTRVLKMLHPYMPFVTEAVWQEYYGKESSLFEEK
ncbi:valine--tRNA ligase [Candidatus Woesebacteria bacterium]|nr:valine--tRNA ligase [Candidatus Woesebacteria bacterium]